MRASLCVLAAAVASANAWIALGPITDGTIELFEVGNDGEAVPGLGLRVTQHHTSLNRIPPVPPQSESMTMCCSRHTGTHASLRVCDRIAVSDMLIGRTYAPLLASMCVDEL
jgi:hypothetical protein